MTVKELIQALAKYPENAQVLVQGYEDGRCLSPWVGKRYRRVGSLIKRCLSP